MSNFSCDLLLKLFVTCNSVSFFTQSHLNYITWNQVCYPVTQSSALYFNSPFVSSWVPLLSCHIVVFTALAH